VAALQITRFGAAQVPTEATSLPTISAVHGRRRNEAPTGDARLSGPEAAPAVAVLEGLGTRGC